MLPLMPMRYYKNAATDKAGTTITKMKAKGDLVLAEEPRTQASP